jgi:hypothetical protein
MKYLDELTILTSYALSTYEPNNPASAIVLMICAGTILHNRRHLAIRKNND